MKFWDSKVGYNSRNKKWIYWQCGQNKQEGIEKHWLWVVKEGKGDHDSDSYSCVHQDYLENLLNMQSSDQQSP